MKQHHLSFALAAAILLICTGLSSASEIKPDAMQQSATKTNADLQAFNSKSAGKQKHAAKAGLVDINSASKRELRKLPGIGNAEADKIIAGRPFGSKAWLVTNNIISMETYQKISGKIICKLTKKEIDHIEAHAAKKSSAN
jgi:competence protein ComEA